MQDLYDILGISKGSTQDEIKKAYRRLARMYHPDVNKTKDAEEKIREINSAYEILGTEEKRLRYDRFGMSSFEVNGSSANNITKPRWGGVQLDINDFMDSWFESSLGMSWDAFSKGAPNGKRDEIYMSKTDLAFLSALVDSYKSPRDGVWLIKATDLDRKVGITESYMYEYKFKDGQPRLVVGFDYNKEKMDKYWRALDSLAFKMATTEPGREITINDEASKINKHCLDLWNNGDKRITAWKIKNLYTELRNAKSLVEFQSHMSTEGNRRSTER